MSIDWFFGMNPTAERTLIRMVNHESRVYFETVRIVVRQ